MYVPEEEGRYFSDSEIVEYITNTRFGLEQMYKGKREDIIQYHFDVGMQLRNLFKMWMQDNPYSERDDTYHKDFPDQRSHRILERCWDIKNGGM